MRKLFVMLKLYWIRIIVLIILIALGVTAFFFIRYCLYSFATLESFTRKQIAGQMALLLPMFVLVQVVTLPILIGLQYYFMQGGFLGRLGKEKAGLSGAKVKWSEVIGMESAKQEAWELVSLLKDRSLVHAIGGKIVKGTLMLGPPGCGKTYLAKAIATECGMPMISVSGSDFVGIFVGQGAAQMKSVFKQARTQAELHGGCLIFIDEIDSFARPRMADTGFGGGISHNATINTFLTEMDGLRKKENNIVVIAATNCTESDLDSAIIRAGRFDRKIYVTRPNLEERRKLFYFYLNKVEYDRSVNMDVLARRAVYFSAADIDGMIREAGIIALRGKRTKINMKDLSESYDRISYGNKSNIQMTDEDKHWTAVHESGHAIIATLHPKDDVVKATIIPRKGFLGFVSHKPKEEYYSHNKEKLLAEIKICLASYVAEEITFGSTTTGVGGGPNSDFCRALEIARSMVWSYGMGKSGYLGDFMSYSYFDKTRLLSNSVKEKLEDDVQRILQDCHKEVREFLIKHKSLLEYFSDQLKQKEELEFDEIVAIFDKFGLKAPRPSLDTTETDNKA